MDELRLYARTLDHQQIRELSTATPATATSQGLVAYWPFEERAQDESGGDHHLVIVNPEKAKTVPGKFGNALELNEGAYLLGPTRR